MAVKIRLRRVGAKKQPAYRIVVADSRAPRDGRFIEIVGSYNPLTHPSTIVINDERALYWLRQGAQPTDVVKKFFVKTGVWSAFSGEPMPEVPVVVEAAPVVEVAPAVVEEAPVVEEVAVVEEVVAEPVAEEVVAEEVAAPVAEEAAAETPAE